MQTTRQIIVATPQIGGSDGVSAVTRQYVDVLQAGARLEVWTLADEPRPAVVGASTTFRSARGGRLTFAATALRAAAVNRDTLVLVMHLHLLPALLPLARRGARLAVLLHGIEAWKPLRRLERIALARAWRIGAVSQYTANRFRAANPDFAQTPIHICHSAARFRPVELGPPEAGPSPFALIVGRMAADERYKGHDLLLEIWPAVAARVGAARLIIVGDGDDRDRLERRTIELGLQAHVTFAGHVSDAALTTLYRDARMLVMPSGGEGLGLVFLEAMAAGTPCVAGVGAAEEVITHGVDGLIVDPADRQMTIDAIVRLFTDRSARDRMAAAAAARAREQYSAEPFAARVVEWLDLQPVPVAC